ncbi:hypothetical protein ERO13_D08G142300v2 [Gossypium hirsutum]|uniref:Uncharacterized protein isoform X1 n=1 Tax=Gossypium hirsutum TaxID=3635 RepID=A0A1U8JUT0_GOSHI|nr:uncharacterized protein LOC107910605 isoform X1 [Gossypium hirsutum]KAG4134201.1 hypothetical protein ERO13_D08G142300v2 [Gossypium hirsutum]
MALVVYWYDCICFGIVAAAFLGSLWVLWRKEAASRCEDDSVYESLLAAQQDADGFVHATPTAHVGSNQLWTSCWKGVHPGWLVLTRFVSFAALAGFLSWDIVDWDASIFVYYTEWTFALVMVYFGLGTVISAYGCWVCLNTPLPENGARAEFLKSDVEESRTENSVTYKENNVRDKIRLQSQRAGFWGYLMQTIYQTCAGAVILTDIVFWCVIVPFLSNSHLGLNTLMGCMHTLNAVFLILDTLLNSLPFSWFRLAYFVQWSCLYVVFQWVLHACGFTWWPYPFLELNTPWAPLWYFALALVHIPCYGMYALIVKAKNSILPRLFPHAFVRSY